MSVGSMLRMRRVGLMVTKEETLTLLEPDTNPTRRQFDQLLKVGRKRMRSILSTLQAALNS